MDSEHSEWTAGHVVDFHDWAGREGRMNASTAAARGSAVKRIFEYVFGEDDWPQQSVKDLDTDELFLRFRNKAKFDVTPKSMETYEGRFTKAIESYTLFNEDQTAWAQSLRASSRAQRTGKTDRQAQEEGKKASAKAAGEDSGDGGMAPVAPRLTAYPFPLHGDVLAQLHLPTTGLTGPDVKRLTTFLHSLVMDEQPALPAGNRSSQ
jgi:hypothetical protein